MMDKEQTKILIVDDDINLHQLIIDYLKRNDTYEIDTTTNYKEAVALLQKSQYSYDLALIDLWFPPDAGGEAERLGILLTEMIKKTYPTTEVIIFTGEEMTSVDDALRAGAYRYLAKTVSLKELDVLIKMAIEHRQLKAESREKKILEQLMQNSIKLQQSFNLTEILNTIVKGVQAIGFDRVRLYLLNETGEMMVSKAAVGMDADFVGLQRPIKNDPYLSDILNNTPPKIFKRKTNTTLPYEDVLGKEKVNEWAYVPLIANGELIGKLAIDNKFTEEPIDQLTVNPVALFASQAAVAIQNAQLRAKEKAATEKATIRARNLEAIHNVAVSINAMVDLPEVLEAICKAGSNLFEVSHSGMVLFAPDYEQGRVVAEYPSLGMLNLEIPLKNIPFEENFLLSKTPYIIDSVGNNTLLGPIKDIWQKFNIQSVLIVPLIIKKRIVGSFSLDMIAKPHRFDNEAVELCEIFAAQVVGALENAELMDQLKEQKDYLNRLFASSPNAVITINDKGQVIEFNEQAEKILGYKNEEVLGKQVSKYYTNPEELNKIGLHLRQSFNDKLDNYETFVRSKTGEDIPIRLTGTWLHDAEGKQIGSVGYFEDLRFIKESEKREELLLKAINTVAKAENLLTGLDSLTKMLVDLLDVTFSRIFFLDSTGKFLITKSAYLNPTTQLTSTINFEERIAINNVLAISQVLDSGQAMVFNSANNTAKAVLKKWSSFLALEQALKTLLVIPLKSDGRVLGVLDLGEIRAWEESPFFEKQKELAIAIANQTAVLINRMYLLEQHKRKEELLTALSEASQYIRADKERPKLLQEIVRLAAALVNCKSGGLYINLPHLKSLELQATYQLPLEFVEDQLSHTDGIIGRVADTGLTEIYYTNTKQTTSNNHLIENHFKRIIGVPLKQAGLVDAVLFVGDEQHYSFEAVDKDILDRFTTQATIALKTSRLIRKEERRLNQLDLLHEISDYIQTSKDLNKILYTTLTGITAGYGLEFNRAAVFLVDETKNYLVGQMGIGYLNADKAKIDWEQSEQEGMLYFKHFLQALEQNILEHTPISKRIQNLHLSILANTDIFSQVVLDGTYIRIDNMQLNELPEQFIQAFEPGFPLVIVPLIARNQVLGILVVDNKFTQSPITSLDIELLLTYANTAAITIDNHQLLAQTEDARQKLSSYFEASNAVVSSLPPKKILSVIVEQARIAADATVVSLRLIDKSNHFQPPIIDGIAEDIPVTEIADFEQMAIVVIETKKPMIIEDSTDPHNIITTALDTLKIKAALCLPILLEGKLIGVMEIYHKQPHYFAPSEITALQLYINQVITTYHSAQQIKTREALRKATEALAGVTDWEAVIKQIVVSARDIMQSDSAFVWSAEAMTKKFISEGTLMGITATGLDKDFPKQPPRSDGTIATIIKEKWLAVTDFQQKESYPFLGESTNNILKRIGARSFQGVVLATGDEILGVLYINYNQVRTFNEEDKETARTFANQASLTLKKAKLLEQIKNARNTTSMVAKATILEDLQNTLTTIVQTIYKTLGCDIVVIYRYDVKTEQFETPSAFVGLEYPKELLKPNKNREGSIIYNILRLNDLHISEDRQADPLVNGAFSQREQVISSAHMPLLVKGYKVGLLAISYRTKHHFTEDEQTDIKLFADQAAVAIYNAQLYKEEQKRSGTLKALVNASQTVARSLDLRQILACAVEQAVLITRYEGKADSFARLRLIDGSKIPIVAVYPPYRSKDISDFAEIEIDLTKGRNGRIGIMGRVFKSGLPELVNNVRSHPDYLPHNLAMNSELAVPIKHNNQVIGVLSVEHIEMRAFDINDQRALESFASQVGIAINNAKLYQKVADQYEELKRTYKELQQAKGRVGTMTAVAWMGTVSGAWRHSVGNQASIIDDLAALIYFDLERKASPAKIRERLKDIQETIADIRRIPMPPLSNEEGVESVFINQLIQERIGQFKHKKGRYKPIHYTTKLLASDATTVRASPEWLRRVIDVIADNAIVAMENTKLKVLAITTQLDKDGIKITFADTGPGIKESVQANLFNTPIKKQKGEKGSGMGLFLAQAIIENYGGTIAVESTSKDGTTIAIWLPVEVM